MLDYADWSDLGGNIETASQGDLMRAMFAIDATLKPPPNTQHTAPPHPQQPV